MRLLKPVVKTLLPIFLIAAFIIAVVEKQALYDWWQLRGYTPPASISQLSSEDTMTLQAKHDFYVNHPQLVSDKTQFQQDCTQTEKTIVLGCYIGGQRGIYIFAVSESKLAGVEQVTAAHEMLHAAYDRLDNKTKTQVDGWLQDYYQHDLKDKRIIATIAAYKKSEPNDVVNEMHSVFGTEISNLPTPLENYYKRYFTNRQKVTVFSDNYEAAFTSLQNQANSLLSQLTSLKNQIQTLRAQLLSEQQSLDSDRNNISTQSQADDFNARVRAYNSQVEYLNSLVAQYNSLRDQYNSLVIQQQQLFNAINTQSVKTVPAN